MQRYSFKLDYLVTRDSTCVIANHAYPPYKVQKRHSYSHQQIDSNKQTN